MKPSARRAIAQLIGPYESNSENCEKLGSNVKYWEIIADRLSKSGWSWGCVSVVNAEGHNLFVVDAHRDDGKRYIVRSDEKLTAFLETEKVTRDARGH